LRAALLSGMIWGPIFPSTASKSILPRE
jgi:hypothetical protein